MHKRETRYSSRFGNAIICCAPWCNTAKKKREKENQLMRHRYTKKLVLRSKLVDYLAWTLVRLTSYPVLYGLYFIVQPSEFCLLQLFPHAHGRCISSFHRSGGIAAADTPFWVDMAEARATGIKQSPLFWRYCIALVMLVSISFTTSSSKAKLSSESCASSNPCALVGADRGWPWQPYMNHNRAWISRLKWITGISMLKQEANLYQMQLQFKWNWRTAIRKPKGLPL